MVLAPGAHPCRCAGNDPPAPVRGGRLRAEVYWNRQLVGYSLEGFTPFSWISPAAGAATAKTTSWPSALPIPAAGTSWVDFNPIPWGDVHLPDSHDFGGIWQDVDLLIAPPRHIENVFAAPREDLETVRVTTDGGECGAQARSVQP